MKIIIHRGTNEIGGNCVEIKTEGTRLIIDFGMPLINQDGSMFDFNPYKDKTIQELIELKILPDIKGIYSNCDNDINFLISHAHEDHYGLLRFVNNNCKIFLSKSCHDLIEITINAKKQNWEIKNPIYIGTGKIININNIEIIPYLVDHSCFGAYSFLIKSERKNIFYSGDFRLHGRKRNVIHYLKNKIPDKIDYLFLEGTSIDREDYEYPTEEKIEEIFAQTFQKYDISFVYTSGQNIDRLVSIYKACLKTRKKMIIDEYIASILNDLSKTAKIPFPSKKFPNLKVINTFMTKSKLKNSIILIRQSTMHYFYEAFSFNKVILIYSLWEGYKEQYESKKFLEFFESKDIPIIDIHTSGHADIKGLREFVNILNPKNIIPIHTMAKDNYKKIFKNKNIILLDDNEILEI